VSKTRLVVTAVVLEGPAPAEAAAAYYGVSEGWGSKLIAPARAYPHACWRRSVRLVADQPLERGLLADRVQVGVVLRGTAKLLRHLDGVPEVIERVTRPAAETLAAGEVVEQHGYCGAAATRAVRRSATSTYSPAS